MPSRQRPRTRLRPSTDPITSGLRHTAYPGSSTARETGEAPCLRRQAGKGPEPMLTLWLPGGLSWLADMTILYPS